ncbi:hypothetical protein M8J77_021242 [Diaphorina citri]|nr:hypothetical protein M8J77_021242 [Diaphorina citri]
MYAPPIHDPYGSDGIPGSVAYYQPPLTHDVNLMYGHNVMVPHPTHIPVLAAVDSQYPVKESRRSHRDRSPPPPPRWAETSPGRESLGRESRHSPSRRSRLSPVKSDRRGSGGGDYKSSRRDIRSRSPPRNKHSRSPPRKRQDRVGQDRASLERGKGRVKDEEEELERLATTPGEIRVRNLPPRTLQREVDALFTWHIGDVTYVEVTDSDGTKAYVKFKTLDHAKRAVDKMYDFNFNDHLIKVYETTEDARKRYEDLRVKRNVRAGPIDWGHTYGLTTSFLESLRIEPPLVPTVFVENVDLIVTPFKLSEVFNLAGRVRNVVLSYDDQCRSKGEAKVEFEHPVEAVQAISMLNGQMLLDRKLKVTMYHEPPPDKLKFPDGLKGVGLGLGQDGAPLRDIPLLLKAADEKEVRNGNEKEVKRERDDLVIDISQDDDARSHRSHHSQGHRQSQGHRESRQRHSSPTPAINNALKELEYQGALKELEDKVLQMACSREGCAVLEQKIASGSENELKVIFRQVISSLMTVVTDMHGSLVVIKLIEAGSSMQRHALINVLKSKGPGFKGLSHHKYAYKVVVTTIEVCPLPLQLEVLEELKGHALFLAKHIHGRHVIEACLSTMGVNYVSFIIQEVVGHVVELLRDMDGILVIKKILLQLPQELSGPVFNEILANAPTIITDSCGYKIINILLENGHTSDTYHVIQALRGVFIFLAQKKHCFPILSKCISLAREDQLAWMIDEICVPDDAGLMVMMKDPNASLILIEILKACDAEQRAYLLSKINRYMNLLHGMEHGEGFFYALKYFQEDKSGGRRETSRH